MGWLIEPDTKGKMMVHEKDTILHDMSYELLMMEFENVNVPRTKEEFRKFARKAFMERVDWAMESFDYCVEEMLRKMFPDQFPKEPKMYNCKVVHTREMWYQDGFKPPIGSYVDEQIVEDLIDALPPTTMTFRFVQSGEAAGVRYDHEKEMWRNTYITYVKIAEGIWEYRGDCFENEYKMRGF